LTGGRQTPLCRRFLLPRKEAKARQARQSGSLKRRIITRDLVRIASRLAFSAIAVNEKTRLNAGFHFFDRPVPPSRNGVLRKVCEKNAKNFASPSFV
jgi:hypothetical protein